MKKIITLFIAFYAVFINAQTNYSSQWEDFFSYNNVKDFTKVNDIIYALADNAVFIYNTQDNTIEKLSSVQGLSGETATAIHYNQTNNRIVIGYKNGLIEVVDADKKITTSPEIINFNQTGEKQINDIFEHNNKLYLATPFAIIVYDIDNLEFGDTYFIAANSSDENIRKITVFNNTIYATTPNGIYTADANNPNLIDFNNWQLQFIGNFSEISIFNNNLYVTKENELHQIVGNSISLTRSFNSAIVGLKSSENSLAITTQTKATFLNSQLQVIAEAVPTTEFDFSLNNAYEENNTIYLATKKFGILKTTTSAIQTFEEIHPEGPLSNDIFSLDVHNHHLWIVYGGYTSYFAPIGIRGGFSHFNGENWISKRYNSTTFKIRDFVNIAIDKNAENKVYISSMGGTSDINSMETGGLLIVENDEVQTFYNQNNSLLEDVLPNNSTYVTVRVGATAFDNKGNLWVANIGAPEKRIKKLSSSGQWSGFDISSLEIAHKYGMYEIATDNNNTLWIGTRQNGMYVFNENGNKKRSFTTEINYGNLPNSTTKTIAVDKNNNVWIGTLTGLVVYNNALNVFNAETINTKPVIILEDGVARRLLGDQTINSIAVDGANNKWFGTETGGVLYANPNGQKTLATFNKDNSPLPSNRIVKIKVDEVTGKVYFATDKGLVVYNSKVAPFGTELNEVYAYPNPALKNHHTITIDGRNGTHLPKGTNIKILDVAGNLVYETNVVEGEQLQGGKAIWNKRNLAGKKVASGVYIVLLSTEDGTETATTKIAIIN